MWSAGLPTWFRGDAAVGVSSGGQSDAAAEAWGGGESGVGGIGPKEDEGGGLRVGGEVTVSSVRVILWDLGGGGTPGGGGGRGIPGCHRVVDGSRECAGDAELMAPVDAARRDPGGRTLTGTGSASSWRVCSTTLLGIGGTGGIGSLFAGDILGFSE